MEEIAKVIHELELCLDDAVAAVVPRDTVVAAIELLNVQKPIAPLIVNGTMHIYCGNCNNTLCNKSDDDLPAYCSECGRPVKWE